MITKISNQNQPKSTTLGKIGGCVSVAATGASLLKKSYRDEFINNFKDFTKSSSKLGKIGKTGLFAFATLASLVMINGFGSWIGDKVSNLIHKNKEN